MAMKFKTLSYIREEASIFLRETTTSFLTPIAAKVFMSLNTPKPYIY
jgi:hypothetical protein